MNRNDTSQQPLTLDPQLDEDRVRRALGLTTTGTHQQRPEQARQRHRFVSDGAVPVVMLNRADGEAGGLKDKLNAVEAALEAERAAHAGTRRALQEAQAANQALQTRMGHATLAHTEALEAERALRREAEQALTALLAEQAEVASRPLPPAAAQDEPEPQPEPAPKLARAVRKPRLPKAEKEPKPVRWWTPSYRAKKA